MYCIGVKSNEVHCQGALMYDIFVFEHTAYKKIYALYIPINGDEYLIKTFGGVDFVYSWVKGAPVSLVNHILRQFKYSNTTHALITNVKYNASEQKLYGVKIVNQLICTFFNNGETMVIYFYVKVATELNYEKYKDSKLDEKIRIAF